ncbi:hypothetical protein CFBP1590__5255 [Pseudomonas viridiflava]|uniref:Uncharacterized protein n=1 Tax=Pseudomonas viridiflava TaxID=33069 RepID=A0A1Y6JUQ5_PSEVI|nr:tetratricopeptide repeat protein [Pseudomonas viridiflava]SMS12841.1 hypothetical protein CFBP1590__5255 [Pseudomonas viridiflava]VVO22128.1 hypothetical protein PS689_04320 [Pseudomonas fluorescens]
MFNREMMTVTLSLSCSMLCHANTDPVDIVGIGGSTLHFSHFNEKFGGWSHVEYKSPTHRFLLYAPPDGTVDSGIGVVAGSDNSMVSPDKKNVLIQRTAIGYVEDPQGNRIVSEQTHCDVISLKSGCAKNLGSAIQCDGEWVGDAWKDSTGHLFDFSTSGSSPQEVRNQASKLSSARPRALSLSDTLFMGGPSYMACYPVDEDIAAYNDLGFYFAEGGEHLWAMQIYEKLLDLAPRRIPLQLNVADSLWALGRHDDAKSHYAIYRDAMLTKAPANRIPDRAELRLK